MFTYFIRRLMATLPMLVGISIVSFLLLHALPGDPASALLGQHATEENVREMRARLGLDDPLPTQYGRYVADLATGELGESHRTSRPVSEELKQRVPATIELALAAMLIASIVGVSLGVLAAVKPRSFMDFLCLSVALTGVSMPVFWLGFLAQKLFAGELGLLPFSGRLDFGAWATFESQTGFYTLDAAFVYQNAQLLLDVLAHLTLPALVLSTVPMALIARITRATMLETLKQDFIRTAKAKGAAPAAVVIRHGLRNALIPILTAIATQTGYLLGGAVLTETIFAWPGLGRYVIEAIDVLDARPLQASVLIIAVTFVVVNLLTDMSYALIDPRLRKRGA